MECQAQRKIRATLSMCVVLKRALQALTGSSTLFVELEHSRAKMQEGLLTSHHDHDATHR